MTQAAHCLSATLALQLDGTRDWTLRLLADLEPADWAFQPAPGLAHALWLCGHFAVSQHILIHARCLNRPLLPDDFCAHFGIGGPIPSADEHAYPPPQELLHIMSQTHAATLAAVREMSDALLAEPAYGAGGAAHPHYSDKFGAVTHCARHEAFHAGQLAWLRRLRGKAFLR